MSAQTCGPIPILDLAATIHGRLNPWKAMLVIDAYFDDSGTHSDSRVILLGGFVATAETWAALELRWQAILDEFKDHGVTHFHAIDCRAGEGVFAKLQMPFRRRVFYELANILASLPILPIWSGVDMAAWHAIGDAPVKKIFKCPLHLCFSDVVRRAMHWSRTEAGGSPVGLVVSEDGKNEPNIERIYGAYRNHPEWGEFLRALTFSRPKNLIPLQAADLIANCLYGDWLRTVEPTSHDDLISVEEPLSRIQYAHGLLMGRNYPWAVDMSSVS